MVSPLLSAMAIAVGAAALHGRVRPRLAATLSMVGIVGVAVAVVPTATVLAVAFLVHLPLLGAGVEWCCAVIGRDRPDPGRLPDRR